jgi:HAE1 family hydrophobic/amphiphilic exporter-1
VSLGLTVLAGMVSATILGTLFIPIFYALIQMMREKVKAKFSSE